MGLFGVRVPEAYSARFDLMPTLRPRLNDQTRQPPLPGDAGRRLGQSGMVASCGTTFPTSTGPRAPGLGSNHPAQPSTNTARQQRPLSSPLVSSTSRLPLPRRAVQAPLESEFIEYPSFLAPQAWAESGAGTEPAAPPPSADFFIPPALEAARVLDDPQSERSSLSLAYETRIAELEARLHAAAAAHKEEQHKSSIREADMQRHASAI